MARRGVVIFIVWAVCSRAFAQVGDRCTLEHNNREGGCKIITDCPEAEEQTKKGIDPIICGFFELTTPIVCCEDSSSDVQPSKMLPGHSIPNSLPNEFNNNKDGQANEISMLDLSFLEQDQTLQTKSERNAGISEAKCEEYSKGVTSTVKAISLVANTNPALNISVPKCDYNSVELIFGGRLAKSGEFPFMAAVGTDSTEEPWHCGGTLISDRYVLTAAHCTHGRGGPISIVRLGELDLSRDGSDHMDYEVSNVTVHPMYNFRRYYDIALLRTKLKIIFTKFIRPACLYTRSDIEYPTGVATGWGKTDSGENSDKLMAVVLHIYENKQCYKTYQDELVNGITSNMLCVGDLKGNLDTCTGDSGGPLVITEKENHCKFYVVGITSFGKSCGIVNTPGIYTRVSEYISWIEQNVWKM